MCNVVSISGPPLVMFQLHAYNCCVYLLPFFFCCAFGSRSERLGGNTCSQFIFNLSAFALTSRDIVFHGTTPATLHERVVKTRMCLTRDVRGLLMFAV